ncbi:MAG: YgiQ family radical SAM protein [Nanoarchaeota archaeon]|nr:YgiQ family radical SAM protein [Nanoarchaeota archaeon]
MQYDIILVFGAEYFDHPLCGVAIIKRLLEKNGYSVGVIEMPLCEKEILSLGKPKLFFGVSSGSIDSMVRNYTPLKKLRAEDKHQKRAVRFPPDRAVTVYSNWIKKRFKDSKIILGGTEGSLRRFVHYDYWENRLRKPILFDTRADILVYGSGEKPILEIAKRIKNGEELKAIEGTCIISRELPDGFEVLPSAEEVISSKSKFCDMQLQLSIKKNLAQKIDTRYCLQYKSPKYTSRDLDEYYELSFTRAVPKELRGFEFSVVTHRGCIGKCNFCSLTLLQGDRVVSRSEESIIREVKRITNLIHFKGNIDDLGGPSANMYGLDCDKCADGICLKCSSLDRSNKRMISLLKKTRAVLGVKNVYIRSGIRFDLTNEEYIKEVALHHIFDTLRIAPEHVNKHVLQLMNKDISGLKEFRRLFYKYSKNKELSYYYVSAHPGSGEKEANELKEIIKEDKNPEAVQIFTPTPMTISTCMYYTGLDPKTKKKIYVPYTYREKKIQKNL